MTNKTFTQKAVELKETLENFFHSIWIPKVGHIPTDFCEQITEEVLKLIPAQVDAVEFAEWCSKYYTYVDGNKWDGDNDDTYTTAELYQLFIQSKQKQ